MQIKYINIGDKDIKFFIYNGIKYINLDYKKNDS